MRQTVRVAIETFTGIVVMFAMVMAVDCLPQVKHHIAQNVAHADPNMLCTSSAKPALLCDRVTKDGRHECAVCREQSCMTQTGVYCVQGGCNDAACTSRGK